MAVAVETRDVRIDMLIPYLKVPVAWRVGQVTFRPPGWLRGELERTVPRSSFADATDRILKPVLASAWSSASVVAQAQVRTPVSGDEARERVRDAIALARLYQRACVPHWSFDHQTFGLPPDIDSTALDHWVTEGARYRGGGSALVGVGAVFEFTKEQVRAFRSRPAFAFLDSALRRGNAPAGSWRQRGISAIRALNAATPLRSQPVRLVLQAVALEALLGDDPPARPGDFRPQAHPVAQRAAFLTCPFDGRQLAPEKTACIDLTARSAREIESHPDLLGRPHDYFDWPCTEYWHLRQVFDARNRALHDAQDDFPKSTAVVYEGRVDDAILAALDWVVATRARGIADLDAAIAALPRADR